MHFTGILIAICTFLIIGLFHPLVIKTEYYWGTKPWWIYLVLGIASVILALFVSDIVLSSLLGILGASFLWSIGELFAQRKRVEKGWFPKRQKEKK
ncbi:DUF4491 family protein [Prevotella sp. A2931]|uniref:DUF4491 family protein n=1 Tax=Prevotella illustrans TaxID=2800387 RepID=A0ABS3M794_9BACT|nr:MULTISPECIES: DUF4491 family protein [Prevotella]MBO1364058.1 DUF4491 family protein [Prevotella illustrans]PTL25643.1 DUF4491 domain-containing protein [Prevotella sp. oral taxon 820]